MAHFATLERELAPGEARTNRPIAAGGGWGWT